MGVLITLVVLVLPAVIAVRWNWERVRVLLPSEVRLPFGVWLIQGVGGAMAMFLLFNSGLMAALPPLMAPASGAAPAAWSSLRQFGFAACGVLWFILTWWAAVSFFWLLIESAPHLGDRPTLIMRSVLWSLAAVPLAVGACLLLGAAGWGLAAAVWSGLICYGWCDLAPARRHSPAYSAAIGKLKLGRVEEAEWAVIGQLEQFPEDFHGWMLLAEIYAEHYRDAAAAERTIFQLCAQPNLNWVEVSIALNRLADWQLQIGEDLEGARFALEDLCRRMPETHLARMARQRLNRLPAGEEEWQRQRKGRTLKLPPEPAKRMPMQDWRSHSGPPMAQEEAMRRVQGCLARLGDDANDAVAREELARLYADHLDRGDLGMDQLQLLIDMPDQPSHAVLRWLELLAQWRMRFHGNEEAARLIWRRMIRDYPHSVEAFGAQRHLSRMEYEGRHAPQGPGGGMNGG